MSHYVVNASVPKTLMAYVIRWVADTGKLGPGTFEALQTILATKMSPELVPGEAGDAEPIPSGEGRLFWRIAPGMIVQLARGRISRRKSVRRIASGKSGRTCGPSLWRFFQCSQFKRSCIPNAPNVGSGGSLSPRGDYRAPSDSDPGRRIKRKTIKIRMDPKLHSKPRSSFDRRRQL
jgi:NAD+ synthase (glutamine-hydrolysing)